MLLYLMQMQEKKNAFQTENFVRWPKIVEKVVNEEKKKKHTYHSEILLLLLVAQDKTHVIPSPPNHSNQLSSKQ